MRGVVSSVEVVHCEGLELTVAAVPVVQIDLSRDVALLFADEESRPKIVHASTVNLAAGPRGGPLQPIRTAAFGEQVSPRVLYSRCDSFPFSFLSFLLFFSSSPLQVVSYYRRAPGGGWELADIASDRLKSGEGGYVELAGVSGSVVDLAELEQQAAAEKK